MYAENVLGDGAPSKPVEVHLRAFLGHLRARGGTGRTHAAQQEHRQRVAPSIGPPVLSSSQGHGDALVSTTRPSSANGVHDPAPRNSGVSSCPEPFGLAVEQDAKQQHGGGLEPSAETGRDGNDAKPQSSASPPAAFDGDFMGLGGFGEDLVDNLFAPPSSASRRRRHRRRLYAPATGGTLESHSLEGEERTGGAHGPYPLPPIVLAAGISGESRGIDATTTHKLGSHGKMEQAGEGGGERACENRCRGGATAGDQRSLCGRSSSSVNTTNNDVFHAFINLGRRLPGRLRR